MILLTDPRFGLGVFSLVSFLVPCTRNKNTLVFLNPLRTGTHSKIDGFLDILSKR